jgi:hypothetical protein
VIHLSFYRGDSDPMYHVVAVTRAWLSVARAHHTFSNCCSANSPVGEGGRIGQDWFDFVLSYDWFGFVVVGGAGVLGTEIRNMANYTCGANIDPQCFSKWVCCMLRNMLPWIIRNITGKFIYLFGFDDGCRSDQLADLLNTKRHLCSAALKL